MISHESCQKSATAAGKSKLTAHEGVGEERGEVNGRHLSKLCGQPWGIFLHLDVVMAFAHGNTTSGLKNLLVKSRHGGSFYNIVIFSRLLCIHTPHCWIMLDMSHRFFRQKATTKMKATTIQKDNNKLTWRYYKTHLPLSRPLRLSIFFQVPLLPAKKCQQLDMVCLYTFLLHGSNSKQFNTITYL